VGAPVTESDSPLFQAVGSVTYPVGEMDRFWNGMGMAGPGANCVITRREVQLRPRKGFKLSQWPSPVRWPDLALPVNEIRCAEELFFGRYRFRLDSVELDGTCFRPIEARNGFVATIRELGIPIKRLSRSTKLKAELHRYWNQRRPRPFRN